MKISRPSRYDSTITALQANYRDLAKDPVAERAAHYKRSLLEISALRSALPDKALSVVRYSIKSQIPDEDKRRPWIWMDKLRTHYTGSTGSSLTLQKRAH